MNSLCSSQDLRPKFLQAQHIPRLLQGLFWKAVVSGGAGIRETLPKQSVSREGSVYAKSSTNFSKMSL